VRLARAELVAARRIVERYETAIVPIARQGARGGAAFYNGMLLGLFQLVDVKQAQVMAHAQHLAALRDYWSARADLERAVGGQLSAAGGGR